MSEFQYFEFRAIDAPLDDRALHALRGISTRATITTTSFENTYLADRSGDRDGWETRLLDRRAAHARKTSLLRRFDGLMK